MSHLDDAVLMFIWCQQFDFKLMNRIRVWHLQEPISYCDALLCIALSSYNIYSCILAHQCTTILLIIQLLPTPNPTLQPIHRPQTPLLGGHGRATIKWIYIYLACFATMLIWYHSADVNGIDIDLTSHKHSQDKVHLTYLNCHLFDIKQSISMGLIWIWYHINIHKRRFILYFYNKVHLTSSSWCQRHWHGFDIT